MDKPATKRAGRQDRPAGVTGPECKTRRRDLCAPRALLRHLRVVRGVVCGWGNEVQNCPGKRRERDGRQIERGEDMGSLLRRGQVFLVSLRRTALPQRQGQDRRYLPSLPARWGVFPGHAVRLAVQAGGVLVVASSPEMGPFSIVFRGRTGANVCSPRARFDLPTQSTSGPTDPTRSRLALLCLRSGLRRAGARPVSHAACLSFPQFPAASRSSEPRSRRGEKPVSRVCPLCLADSRTADIPTRQNVRPSHYTGNRLPRDLCVRTPSFRSILRLLSNR